MSDDTFEKFSLFDTYLSEKEINEIIDKKYIKIPNFEIINSYNEFKLLKFNFESLTKLFKKHIDRENVIIKTCYLTIKDKSTILKNFRMINSILNIFMKLKLDNNIINFYKENNILKCEISSFKFNEIVSEYDLLKEVIAIIPEGKVGLTYENTCFLCRFNLKVNKEQRIENVF